MSRYEVTLPWSFDAINGDTGQIVTDHWSAGVHILELVCNPLNAAGPKWLTDPDTTVGVEKTNLLDHPRVLWKKVKLEVVGVTP